VLTAGQGQNPARQAAILAGIPEGRTAFSLNQVCGSGLRAVALAAQQIQTGQSDIVVAGGQESMTLSTHCAYLRAGTKMGDLGLVDTMIKDGLWDAFNGYHMGTTAENVATAFQITRQQQDEFAAASQNKASAAQKSGRFADEIAPVTVKGRKGDVVVSDDEYIRHDSTPEAMAKLRPAFSKEGTVTAGNASGLNDGAAALVVMSASEAARRGLTPLARIASFATAGVDPKVMGTGPIPSSTKALERAGWRAADLDLVEANDWPPDRCVGGAGADDAALRDAEARREEGPGDALHRRRDGRRDVFGAVKASALYRRPRTRLLSPAHSLRGPTRSGARTSYGRRSG
jgi:acetyl-CoA C-acetyltransferase